MGFLFLGDDEALASKDFHEKFTDKLKGEKIILSNQNQVYFNWTLSCTSELGKDFRCYRCRNISRTQFSTKKGF